MKILIILLSLALPAQCFANSNYQSLEMIKESVRQFLMSKHADSDKKIKISVKNLDRRLKLQACEEDINLFLPYSQHHSRQITVGVKCATPKPWMIYVSASVKIQEKVLVTKKHVQRTSTIKRDDVTFEYREIGSNYSFISDPGQAVGKVALRDLAAGTVLTERVMAVPTLVKRGDGVKIIAKSGNMILQMTGTAMSDGVFNEVIRIRNNDSNRIINGIVKTDGIVEVPL